MNFSVNLTEGEQILRPNLLLSRKTLLSVPDIGREYQAIFDSHSLESRDVPLSMFVYISYSEMPRQSR